jgi:alpha-L-fucosidase
MPAEVDVSIRKGWFYRESENETVKSADQLMDIYLKSVGRNANLLLNVPPDTRGKIHEKDSASLMEFAAKRNALMGNDMLKKAMRRISEPDKQNPNKKYSWYYMLKEPVKMKALHLREDLLYGQKISSLQITVSNKGEAVFRKTITTVGNNRIIIFPEPVDASEVSIVVLESKGLPVMKEVKGF